MLGCGQCAAVKLMWALGPTSADGVLCVLLCERLSMGEGGYMLQACDSVCPSV